MAHKKKHVNPVPPGNQPHQGPPELAGEAAQDAAAGTGGGAPFQDQDPKRRFGQFEGAGEHPYQQPGGLHDADH